MDRLAKVKRVRRFIYIVLALFILLGTQHIASGSTLFYIAIQTSTLVDLPPLILQNVTSSFIYTNNTSAKVTVPSSGAELDVLQIINQTSDNNWQLQLIKYNDTDITRLTNCTIWLHNETTTSVQIKIIDGIYNQTSGNLYEFTSNNTKITIIATTNATGTSLIYTYLKILKPDTSTYSLYTITFEITDT
jgi:hypothetical protein